jgi:hypothetical protein
MKLQQKLESSLDDIIKTTKKKPTVAQKSKGITRGTLDKLKRLKSKRNGPQQNKDKAQRQTDRPKDKSEKPKEQKGFEGKNKNKNRNRSGPRDFPAGKKWTAPKRGSRFNRNFRGRNRN